MSLRGVQEMNNGAERAEGGVTVLHLFKPKIWQLKNTVARSQRKGRVRALAMGGLALSFWVLIFAVVSKVLIYFQNFEGIGLLLAEKLLSMVLLTFMSVLLFSNLVTSLSAYYISDELDLILSSPVDIKKVYLSKFSETVIGSSWMVLLFSLPVFLAYGKVYHLGPGYYFSLAASLPPFFIIAASAGIAFIMILVNFFPARRTKDILVVISILIAGVLYMTFRFIQPERLVRPAERMEIIDMLKDLDVPSSVYIPSTWVVNSLVPFLTRSNDSVLFYQGMLWSTAAALLVLGLAVSSSIYRASWSKAQEAKRARITRRTFFDRLIRASISPFPNVMKEMMVKDIKAFFRDVSQWSQLFLLLALIAVYLYNVKVLPMDDNPFLNTYLKNVIAFLNLGMAGFVLSAVAVRFVFPSVSLEGKAMWILSSSPVTMKSVVWGKFWMALFPLLVLGEILIVATNRLLDVDPVIGILGPATIAFLNFGIVGLGVGIGAIYPRFHVENAAKIATSFGGIVYMILAMSLVAVVVVLEAGPVWVLIRTRMKLDVITPGTGLYVIVSLVVAIALSMISSIIPMKLGIKKLENSAEESV